MRRALLAAAALAAAAALPAPAHAAGSLTVVSSGDVDYLDPGATYYQYGYMVQEATHRPLYRRSPASGDASTTRELVPDLAQGPPEVLDGGRTIVVPLRGGVRFSPPFGRAVLARDVEYAIERTFMRAVPNGYAALYLRDVVGLPAAPARRHRDIPGIVAQDDRTLVLRLRRPSAANVIPFLTLPFTAPVPRELAQPLDERRRGTSRYGTRAAHTGPYRVASYRANRSIVLERNPSWDAATDPTRPAHLDRIELRAGATNPTRAIERVVGGRGLVSGDIAPTPPLLRSLQANRPDQVATVLSQGARWITFGTRGRTFRRRAVRRAVAIGLDKTRLLATRGGTQAGLVATHFIPPGIGGFAQAGGEAGPGGPLSATTADVRGARRALRRAGVRRGRTLRVVVDDLPADKRTARAVRRQLRRLGFRVRLRVVPVAKLFEDYCSGKKPFDVLVGYGWLADAPDGFAMVGLPFSGPQSSVNCSGYRSRSLDRAIARAQLAPAGEAYDAAWAAIDRRILEAAPAVPFAWDRDSVVRSADVRGEVSGFSRLWDLSTLSVGG